MVLLLSPLQTEIMLQLDRSVARMQYERISHLSADSDGTILILHKHFAYLLTAKSILCVSKNKYY